ncbi:MAG: TRAP transporter substrate-binding protein DctP [Rhodospirillales bacterium]|nr:TRAP transporter substrate-binding protein DctP [Rhodospirillales bacterium]
MKHFKIMAFAVAAAALLAATGVQARELVYGAWVSPKHGVMVDALPHMFKGVAKDTNGAVTWKLVAGGQLVKGKNTLAGIRDGLIDAGLAISVFTPKNVPSTAILHSTLIAGNDNVAVTAAQNETVLLDCPSCTAEWKVNNAVYLAGYAPTPFKLMCRDKITNLKELKGKKVRVTGGSVQLMKMAGATPVSMTPAEATTALQRGTIDCVLGAVAWLKSYGYQDVAKHLIDYPLGVIGPAVSVAINRKTWLGMTDAQRKAHIKYMPMVVAQSALSAYLFRDNAILADAIKVGDRAQGGTGI